MTDLTQPKIAPTLGLERIQSLDVMRGFILFGILLMNINGFGLAHAYVDPTVTGGSTGLNLYTWIATNLFFEGTMRALFSMLFGVGMFIFLDRLLKKDAGIKAADIYFRRLMYLLVFGLIHGYLLLWVGEILYQYALMGFLVYSFRKMAPKNLIAVAIFLICIGTFWNYLDFRETRTFVNQVEEATVYKAEGKELTEELKAAFERWEKREKERTAEAVEEYNSEMRKGYFSVVAFLAPTNFEFDTVWPYRNDVWDVLSMMLIGIALFRWNILSAEKSFGFYGVMALVGYAVGLAINYYEIKTIMDSDFAMLAFAKTEITYYWGRLFISFGHVGAILLFCKSGVLAGFQRSMAAVGKMALTNYMMHSVICMIVFTGVGFGMFGKFQRYELLYVVFSIWIFQLILSPIWLKNFYYGPMEWLWRSLSYQKLQPLKRTESATPKLAT